jgi:hypothetical protein
MLTCAFWEEGIVVFLGTMAWKDGGDTGRRWGDSESHWHRAAPTKGGESNTVLHSAAERLGQVGVWGRRITSHDFLLLFNPV